MEYYKNFEHTYCGGTLVRSRMTGILQKSSEANPITAIEHWSKEISDLKKLKELSKFFYNLYWKKYVISKRKNYFKDLADKQFRATFGHIKATITIEIVELPSYIDFENDSCKENIADDIQFAYTTSNSSEIFYSSLKDLIEKNEVDFDNPIVKGW